VASSSFYCGEEWVNGIRVLSDMAELSEPEILRKLSKESFRGYFVAIVDYKTNYKNLITKYSTHSNLTYSTNQQT